MVGLVASACSDDAGTTAAPTSTTVPSEARAIVEELTSDELQGRDNATPGSQQAQALLSARLEEVTEPLPGATDGYRWPIPQGTNLLGMVPGGDQADQYVVVGAHYDHLGTHCRRLEPDDRICNGAQDNAAGVAEVLEIARHLADGDAPRRSVIIALWDAEEDGLLGSLDFVQHPPVPLEDVVAYVNFDDLGQNLLPSLADTTFMIGAETGGPALQEAAEDAAADGPLTTLSLSLLFGQGRSDHASFTAAGVPAVFFSDANSGCYHSTSDELAVVDFDKLEAEAATGERLVRHLAETDELPTYTATYGPGAPPATYDDAEAILDVVQRGLADLDLLPAEYRPLVQDYVEDLTDIVDAGPEAFDDAAVSRLLSGAVDLVDALSHTACDGYLD